MKENFYSTQYIFGTQSVRATLNAASSQVISPQNMRTQGRGGGG